MMGCMMRSSFVMFLLATGVARGVPHGSRADIIPSATREKQTEPCPRGCGGGGTDLRGGFGKKQAGKLYNTEEPLFNFRVLVTGYEPFLAFDFNPAQEVAGLLNGTCGTVYLTAPFTFVLCYDGMALPVSSYGSSWAALALEKEPTRWDAVVHLGFESWARGLRLETIAANVKGSEEYHHMRNSDVPCSKEGTPFRYIQEEAPCILPTTAPLSYLNLEDLTMLLESSGYRDLASQETWSRDAGTYFCNEQYFRTLYSVGEAAEPGAPLIPVMFIHLPHHDIMDLDDMAVMVNFIAQNLVLGAIGLLVDPQA